MLQITTKLVLKLFPLGAFATGIVSEEVAGLDHELQDDTMEDHAFEVPASGLIDEVLNVQTRLIVVGTT